MPMTQPILLTLMLCWAAQSSYYTSPDRTQDVSDFCSVFDSRYNIVGEGDIADS